MAKVLIIGAGGVGRVVTHKCAQVPEVFEHIVLASRTEAKCKNIAAQLSRPIDTAQVDADKLTELVALISDAKPFLVINITQHSIIAMHALNIQYFRISTKPFMHPHNRHILCGNRISPPPMPTFVHNNKIKSKAVNTASIPMITW